MGKSVGRKNQLSADVMECVHLIRVPGGSVLCVDTLLNFWEDNEGNLTSTKGIRERDGR